jgi:hypothetical protein
VQYDYRYEDTDNMMNELEEFFPYIETSQFNENEKEFAEDFREGTKLLHTSLPSLGDCQ